MAKVEERVPAAALFFTVELRRGGEGLGCNASGGVAPACEAAAAALRAGAAAAALGASGDGAARRRTTATSPQLLAAPVADQCLLAGVTWAGGGARAFSANASVNTRGNVFEDVDALMAALGSGVPPRGEDEEPGALALRPNGRADGSGGLPPTPPDAPAAALSFHFNLLIGPFSEATASARLSQAPALGVESAIVDALAAAVNAPTHAFQLALPGSSVAPITLVYNRSRWALLLAWLRAHVGGIVGAGAGVGALLCAAAAAAAARLRRRRRRRAPEAGTAAVAAARAWLVAARERLASPTRRAGGEGEAPNSSAPGLLGKGGPPADADVAATGDAAAQAPPTRSGSADAATSDPLQVAGAALGGAAPDDALAAFAAARHQGPPPPRPLAPAQVKDQARVKSMLARVKARAAVGMPRPLV
jgi:hypothetical protein